MGENNGFVTRDILDGLAGKRTFHVVPVDGYGKFRIRSWVGDDRNRYLDLTDKSSSAQRSAVAIVLSLVDADDELMLPYSPEVVSKVASWPLPVLEPLERLILRINGLDTDIEELAGNSKAATSGDFGSS